MKIAIISDIHGNYPALKNVIDDAAQNNVDKYIFIGDYIFDLPYSHEVVQTIRGLQNAYIIKGNKERSLYGLRSENQETWTNKQFGAAYQTYRELTDDDIEFLLGLQDECFIPLDSGKVIYAAHFFKGIEKQAAYDFSSFRFHEKMLSNPSTHEEYLQEFQETLQLDYLKNAINKIDADVILFGHNHIQGYGYCGEKLVINPGSCGIPCDFNKDVSYTILEENDKGFNVIEKRVSYDIEMTIQSTKKSNIYVKGTIWLELCFLAMKTGRGYYGVFFGIANKIAESKGETGQFFSDETWEEAYREFLSGKQNIEY